MVCVQRPSGFPFDGEQTLALPTQDAATIRRAAGQCLRRVALTQRLRLLGVRVGSLVPESEAAPQPASSVTAALF